MSYYQEMDIPSYKQILIQDSHSRYTSPFIDPEPSSNRIIMMPDQTEQPSKDGHIPIIEEHELIDYSKLEQLYQWEKFGVWRLNQELL